VFSPNDTSSLDDLSKHEKLGEFEFELSNLVTAPNQTLENSFSNGEEKIQIVGSEKKPSSGQTTSTFSVDIQAMSNEPIFFTISKKNH